MTSASFSDSSASFSPFLTEKHSIFARKLTLDELTNEAQAKDYAFLLEHKKTIEQEFNQIYAVLLKKGKDREEFWLWCYYCCAMLETYYLTYGDPAKVADYAKLKAELALRCQHPELKKKTAQQLSFFKMLGRKIAKDLADLATIPLHLSKLRSQVGFLNVCRIYWTFCRLTLKSSFLLAQEAQWIEKLSKLLGKQINVDQIIHILEAPNPIFRGLSVGFFVVRIIMNSAMLLKHTLFASAEEKKTTSLLTRTMDELVKRHPQYLNDTVWALMNGVTNYNEFFHISAPVAGWLTAGFLVFDFSLLLWQRHLARQDYLAKKSQYTIDWAHYDNLLKEAQNEEDRAHYQEQCRVIQEQMIELRITWETQNANFLFNATAALLLAIGFSASMVLTGGLFGVASFAVCTFGVAMYLTDFTQFKEKSLRLEQAQVEQDRESIAVCLKEYQTARNDFLIKLIKNALLPAVMIAAFAICWQAAVVLTIMYLAYEVINYSIQAQKAELSELVLATEVDLTLESEQPANPLAQASCEL